ncbi:MAG: hypothetical protein FWD59_03960, partial [Micrococcales bacterium]|nr:hypothetical protein [Micrococcales bacterium]
PPPELYQTHPSLPRLPHPAAEAIPLGPAGPFHPRLHQPIQPIEPEAVLPSLPPPLVGRPAPPPPPVPVNTPPGAFEPPRVVRVSVKRNTATPDPPPHRGGRHAAPNDPA